ncbi:MAG: protein-disulfide isomerase [Porticoccus sp.]|jgi:thiol:disulfide interchange protein DsbC|nr:protein-disulfide isomerase [Porticoccus sp.]|tara:strand:+ start:383 stop:1153 length:771 start_codon:yes stop_codon:yes gene_type:complete
MKKKINNMLFFKLNILGLLIVFFSTFLNAAEKIPEDVSKKIKSTLKLSRPDLKFDNIERTKIPNLYLIKVDPDQYFYTNENGEYLIVGDMYQAKPFGFIPVVSDSILDMRKNIIKEIPKSNMIIFPSVGETMKTLYVFTDVDCHFCRKFHNETLPDLTLAGVEIRYLAFPRAGLDSESYKKMASAWCAEDKNGALSSLKKSELIDEYVCKKNPIRNQLDLGLEIGITGTPAMLTEDGILLVGYRSAKKLLEIISSY